MQLNDTSSKSREQMHMKSEKNLTENISKRFVLMDTTVEENGPDKTKTDTMKLDEFGLRNLDIAKDDIPWLPC